jgi:hypothetical protein
LTNQNLEHIYYTLLWQVLGFAMPFTSLSKLCKNTGPNRHPIWLCNVRYWAPVELLLHLHLSATGNISCLSVQSFWKLCCLYWNMLTEYRMKPFTIFCCTKGWWAEIHLVPAWKLCVFFERIIQPWLLICTTMGLINGWPIGFSNSDENPFP